jgi:hypothetical protein
LLIFVSPHKHDGYRRNEKLKVGERAKKEKKEEKKHMYARERKRARNFCEQTSQCPPGYSCLPNANICIYPDEWKQVYSRVKPAVDRIVAADEAAAEDFPRSEFNPLTFATWMAIYSGIPPETKFYDQIVDRVRQYHHTPVGDPRLFGSTRSYGNLWAKDDSYWSRDDRWIRPGETSRTIGYKRAPQDRTLPPYAKHQRTHY